MRGPRIANARGVPGTAGALVRDRWGRDALLASHHVLYADGAVRGDRVWAVPDEEAAGEATLIGRAGVGLRGRVSHGERVCFVDCALIELDARVREGWITEMLAGPWPREAGTAVRGAIVSKNGAGTGRSTGRILDVAHRDRSCVDGDAEPAPGQILVACTEAELCFSAEGDSGAALVDAEGRAVGLLWGSNASGEGVACPMDAVLAHLSVTLVGWPSRGMPIEGRV